MDHVNQKDNHKFREILKLFGLDQIDSISEDFTVSSSAKCPLFGNITRIIGKRLVTFSSLLYYHTRSDCMNNSRRP